MWNSNQGMASGQASYAPPPYDTVQLTPSDGQPPSVPPPAYTRSPPAFSPYSQNHSAPPPYSQLTYVPSRQGYSITGESSFGAYSSGTNHYPSLNRSQNLQANQKSCECQECRESHDSHRHRGIIGLLRHGHHKEGDHHHGHQTDHGHHQGHQIDRGNHHGHHGVLGLIRHHIFHESHDN